MKPFKLLAADDEQIALDSIRFIVARDFAERITLYTARSGREVIEAARACQPDIVLMDILMPGIDGLAAIGEIKQFDAGALFLIVSAYEKFDYVKEALGLGVLRYLSKPVSRGRMVAALEEALQLKESERQRLSRELAMQEKMAMVLPMLESGFIYSLLSSGEHGQELASYRTLLSLPAEGGYVMTVEFGEKSGRGELANKIGSGVRSQQHYSMLRDAFKACCDCVVGPVMLNRVVAFVPCGPPESEYARRTEALETAGKVHRKLQGVLPNADFVIGIGRWCPELSLAGQSYEDSLRAVACAPQGGGIVHIGDIRPQTGVSYPTDIEKLLLRQLTSGSCEDALHTYGLIWEWSMEEFGKRFQDRRAALTELVAMLNRVARENGALTVSPGEAMKALYALADDGALNAWLQNQIRALCEELREARTSKLSDIVRRAVEYIAANFTRELTLEEVSRECSVSPTYFSKLFKDEMGCNFIDYLTELRMEKSKRLLSDSEFQGKEICYQVGYSDPNYFSRIFKKTVGMTPTEYRAAQNAGRN